MTFEPRWYRKQMDGGRFVSFTVEYLDTDLWIGVDKDAYSKKLQSFCLEKITSYRRQLDEYIAIYPDFRNSLVPIQFDPKAPEIARDMIIQSQNSGTGPMACVAGAFANWLGTEIIQNFNPQELIIENGGDIFVLCKSDLKVAVYAGGSPISGKIGILIPPDFTPLGICTSSGTVGPSMSFGKSDATMICCKNAALADGYASFFGNQVTHPDGIHAILESISKVPEIISAIIVCEDKFGINGKFNLEIIKS
jgi:uncharacterized protein